MKKTMFHNQADHPILTWLLGLSSSALAVLSTFQEQVEWWIRTTGGLFFLGISAISFFSLVFTKFKKMRPFFRRVLAKIKGK